MGEIGFMSAQVRVVGMCIVAFLVSSTFAVWLIYRTDRERHEDLLRRTLSWYPVTLFCLGGMLVGRVALTLGFVWVSAQVFRELARSDSRLSSAWAFPLALSIAIAQYGAMLLGAWEIALAMVPCLLVSGVCLSTLVSAPETRQRLRAFGWTTAMSVWVVGCLPALSWVPIDQGEHGWGGAFLFLLIITQINDVFQYIWGRLLGRRKLAPKISPKKTWEGVIGGVTTMGIIGALLGEYISSFGLLAGGVIAVILCLGGVIGDLTFSVLKRARGLKDFGDLLPGFGGVLDRIDSLAFNAPGYLLLLFVCDVARALLFV